MSVRGVVGAICTLAVVATGCISGTESVSADVSPAGWDQPVEMRYVNSDSLRMRSLALTLRHSASVVHSNGRYTLVRISPSGIAERDTLTIDMTLDTERNALREASARPVSTRLTEGGEWRMVVIPHQNTVGVWSISLDIK